MIEKIKVGDVVQYIGCSKEQIQWGNNDDPSRSFLIIGKKYVVSDVEIHSQHTKITIANTQGKFNSVCFSKCTK